MRIPPGLYQLPGPTRPPATGEGQRHTGHAHFWQRALSRRQVIRTAAGGTAAVLGSGLLVPGMAQAARSSSAAPRPIPEVLIPGTPFHVLFPDSEEPSTIYDFNGFVGATDIQGTGTGGLLFDLDMRFMQGVYVGVDGRLHRGTFGFVWLDLYQGQYDFANFSTQVHDFDSGIHPYPDGLFWTTRIADDSVTVHLGAGEARLSVANQPVLDYFSIPNALSDGPHVTATVSYDITWHTVKRRRQVFNTDLHVAGTFLDTDARIAWSGSNANGFHFTASPEGQTAVIAQIGHERNGVFFG